MPQEIRQLDTPRGPIVRDIVSPIINPSGNVFGAQNVVHDMRVVQTFVFPRALPDRQDNLRMTITVQQFLVVQIRQIFHRELK